MNKKSILSLTLLAAMAFSAPSIGFSAPKKEKAAATEDGRAIPYHGAISAVDAAAKTFTIKGKQKDRVFSITDKTVITKDGAPADITALTAGAEVRGQATKTGDAWEAVKVMLGAKEGKAAKTAKKDEAKPADAGATATEKPAEAAPAAPAPAPADAAPAAPADAAK